MSSRLPSRAFRRGLSQQPTLRLNEAAEFSLLPAARWHWHRNGLSMSLLANWPKSGPKGHITKFDVLQNIPSRENAAARPYKFLLESFKEQKIVDAALKKLNLAQCRYAPLADFGGQIEFHAADDAAADRVKSLLGLYLKEPIHLLL